MDHALGGNNSIPDITYLHGHAKMAVIYGPTRTSSMSCLWLIHALSSCPLLFKTQLARSNMKRVVEPPRIRASNQFGIKIPSWRQIDAGRADLWQWGTENDIFDISSSLKIEV